MRALIAPLLVLMSTNAPAQSSTSASSSSPEIVNVSRGETVLRPDRASLTIAVVTHAASAAVAAATNARRLAPLLAALRRYPLPDSAIVTRGFNVEADYQDGRDAPKRASQYTARNAVQVSLRTLVDLGALIDTALANGATEIGEIAFESSGAAGGRQRAIGLAVQAARVDAEAAATAAGGRLGAIVELTIDPDDGSLRRVMRLEEVVVTRSAGTAILPGELKAIVHVRIRWALIRAP